MLAEGLVAFLLQVVCVLFHIYRLLLILIFKIVERSKCEGLYFCDLNLNLLYFIIRIMRLRVFVHLALFLQMILVR